MITDNQITRIGTRIATVARRGAALAATGGHTYPIWTGAVYEAKPRADGLMTWRRIMEADFGIAKSGKEPSGLLVRRLRECVPVGAIWASDMGLTLKIRHGTPCP